MQQDDVPQQSDKGQLRSRPNLRFDWNALKKQRKGIQSIPFQNEEDCLLYVPSGYDPSSPAPLVLALHGCGRGALQGLDLFYPFADDFGLIVLAPTSRRSTWDLILKQFGSDVDFIDEALAKVFADFNVDATRIAIGGFSDGASYSLSLGLRNNHLFSHIIAFSPGFVVMTNSIAKPGIFLAHGTLDNILPIRCSYDIHSELIRAKYKVAWQEFEGTHTVPSWIGKQATEWLAASDVRG